MNATLRALNRFGLGARIGDRQRIGDPRGWLRAQLEGGAPLLRPPAAASSDAIGDAVRAFRTLGQASQQARQQAQDEAEEVDPPASGQRGEIGRRGRVIRGRLTQCAAPQFGPQPTSTSSG